MAAELLPFPTAARPPEVVQADIRVEVARHGSRMDVLLAELDGRAVRAGALEGHPTAARSASRPVFEEPDIVTLKEAANEIDWREERLKSHLVRWLREHPEEPPIGWQAGGRRSCPWIVDMNRLRRYVGVASKRRRK